MEDQTFDNRKFNRELTRGEVQANHRGSDTWYGMDEIQVDNRGLNT